MTTVSVVWKSSWCGWWSSRKKCLGVSFDFLKIDFARSFFSRVLIKISTWDNTFWLKKLISLFADCFAKKTFDASRPKFKLDFSNFSFYQPNILFNKVWKIKNRKCILKNPLMQLLIASNKLVVLGLFRLKLKRLGHLDQMCRVSQFTQYWLCPGHFFSKYKTNKNNF